MATDNVAVAEQPREVKPKQRLLALAGATRRALAKAFTPKGAPVVPPAEGAELDAGSGPRLMARPMIPADLPVLKRWIRSHENCSGFDVQTARGSQFFVVRDVNAPDAEPVLYQPFWVSITMGCPLPRPGLSIADQEVAGDVALAAVTTIATAQNVPEINAAINSHAMQEFLQEHGWRKVGQFMRRHFGEEKDAKGR